MFRHVPHDHLVFLLSTDSGLANTPSLRSQTGWMIAAVDYRINQGYRSPMSCLAWKSHRLKTTTSSTLMSETKAMSEGLSELEWVMAFWAEAHNPRIDFRQFLDGEITSPNLIVLREHESEFMDQLRGATCVTDCKSVFDVLSKETTSSDKRTAVDLQIIREFFAKA